MSWVVDPPRIAREELSEAGSLCYVRLSLSEFQGASASYLAMLNMLDMQLASAMKCVGPETSAGYTGCTLSLAWNIQVVSLHVLVLVSLRSSPYSTPYRKHRVFVSECQDFQCLELLGFGSCSKKGPCSYNFSHFYISSGSQR